MRHAKTGPGRCQDTTFRCIATPPFRAGNRAGGAQRRPRPHLAGLGLCLAACPAVAGCSRTPAQGPGGSPPNVTVSYPLEREVTDFEEYPGRTAADDAVQLRARVNGYLQTIYFMEGAEVTEGEVLYQIDPRPYKAALDQAAAQVRLQEANSTVTVLLGRV
jgi:multidrug efflux pump subunit AcrA (membrane-fusion protein)